MTLFHGSGSRGVREAAGTGRLEETGQGEPWVGCLLSRGCRHQVYLQ